MGNYVLIGNLGTFPPVPERYIPMSFMRWRSRPSASRLIFLDPIGGPLGHGIDQTLRVVPDHQGEDAGVDDAQVGGAMDAQAVGDDAAPGLREHGAGAERMVFGREGGADVARSGIQR